MPDLVQAVGRALRMQPGEGKMVANPSPRRDSGASTWTAARREAYANDQDAAAGLVEVTARTNCQKADRDPSAWMPLAPTATCPYLAEWTTTKLRWDLTADQSEIDTINVYAADRAR
ncbi:hypothetical protein [Streptomyces canus]|uniref:hypothetical protein n=1 Tax=Streptomyces canus TaxID=58343 RepID=UPI00386F37C4